MHKAAVPRVVDGHCGAKRVKPASRRRLGELRFIGLLRELEGARDARQTWILVARLNLRYHNKENILFTIDPYYGHLNEIL